MKDPAFLFYPGDWMGGTQWMTLEQKGCYIELLILQFNTEKFTEAQAKQVLSICFEVAWPIVKQKFVLVDGFYFNERLQEEINKRRKFTESRRINGLASKDPLNKEKKEGKHMPKHMENENEVNNEVDNTVDNTISNTGEFFETVIKWMKENSPTVLKMTKPFTEKQFIELQKDFSNDQIKHLLLKMENWKPLLTKTTSANLTFRAWSKNETFKDMVIGQKPNHNERKPMTEIGPGMTGEEYLYWGLKPEYR